MRTTLPAALLCAFLASLALGATPKPAAKPSPKPSVSPAAAKATAPPEIYHTVVRPVCSALQAKIKPAIGMLLQNDQTIAKSPKMFKEYAMAQFNKSEAQQSMTVLHLENLVSPLADNVLAIQKLLEDPSVFPARAHDDEDKRTLDLKNKLLASLAQQQAALDLINGFVETQNLADMQHQGFGYISAIAGRETTTNTAGRSALDSTVGPKQDPTHPSPFDDTVINAGLPTNPYEIDLTRVPGLALGYNPVNNIREGIEWTQGESEKSEATLAKTVMDTVKICGGGQPAATPSPTP